MNDWQKGQKELMTEKKRMNQRHKERIDNERKNTYNNFNEGEMKE